MAPEHASGASRSGRLLGALGCQPPFGDQLFVDPMTVPLAWHRFAFRSYLVLQWVDGKLLEPRLPADLFYNLLLSARRPL